MFKKKDVILIGVLIAISIIVYIVVQLIVKKDGKTVVIKVDGQIKYELAIDENTNVTVNGYQGGVNTVVVENGYVYMKDADCPDKICENTGKISKTGETIVCLPHRVVVEIKGKNNNLDGVVK